MGDHFYTSPYTAIGRDSFSPPSWGWGFSYHEVAWSGGCQGLRRGKTAALAFGVFGRLQRLPVVVPELVRLAA